MNRIRGRVIYPATGKPRAEPGRDLPWSKADDELVRRRYPAERTEDIAVDLGRSKQAVKQRASSLGVAKNDRYESRRVFSGGDGVVPVE